ncbi:MAG: hypothetical protein GXY86_14245, partial [Firmicutes bacterium]|nr:hypothetical protein [Bacillota bacterium]
NDRGDKQLVAYVVEQPDQKIEIDEILEHLRERLPDYMMPGSFVKLTALPLTFTGKVDRRLLKAAGGESLSEKRTYEAPRNEMEKQIADIWGKILHLESISINDNLFDLGADSLKALTFITEIRKMNIENLSLNDVPKNPTIRKLAGFIKEKQEQSRLKNNVLIEGLEKPSSGVINGPKDSKLTIESEGISISNPQQKIVIGEVPLTPVQIIHFERNPKVANFWNTTAILFCRNGFNVEFVKEVFTKLTIYHDALRMVYKTEGEKIIQYNRGLEGKMFDLKTFNLKDIESPTEVVIKETANICGSVDLGNGPLVKLGLFQTKQGDHLLISVHHLVSDWYSLFILLHDFVSGYQQVLNHQPIRWPAKTCSLRDWAYYLYEYSNSKDLLDEIPYWERVEAVGTVLFKREHNIHENLQRNVRNIKIKLTKDETSQLRKQAIHKYQTGIPELTLVGLGLTLKEWLGEEKIIIHCLSNGRHGLNGIDLTRTMGYLNVGYPFVLDMSNSENLPKTISLTRDNLHRVPNQGIGYEILNFITPTEKTKSLKFNLKTELIFNFFGEFDNVQEELISVSPVPVIGHWGQDYERGFSLFIEGIIVDGELSITLNYDKIAYKDETVSRIADSFRKNLDKILVF